MRVRAPIVVESPGMRHDAELVLHLHGKVHAAKTRLVGASLARGGTARFDAQRLGSVVVPARRDPRGGKISLAFLAFLAFLALTSFHQVAHARAVGVSTDGDLATSGGDHRELASAAAAPPHCRQNVDATPVRELEAVEAEDSEDDAGLDAPGASLTVTFAPRWFIASQAPCITSLAWMTQYWVASALPRGPPLRSR